MIAVIDTDSRVRHACFNKLTEIGHSVVVFHSPDTFIDSGALYNTNLLILGKMRVRRTEAEALLWASAIRPDLRTLLVGQGEIQLKHLGEAFEMEKAETSQADIFIYLAEIQAALGISTSMYSDYPVSTWPVDSGEAQVA